METVVRERMVSQLKELGLSTYEALTYITLLTRPSITAGMLCKETGIPDSKIYYTLDGLSRRGMLVVQKGNPSIYLPVQPKEAIASLKQQLTESLTEKIRRADVLIDLMTPAYESARRSEELEFAYIIRGQNNIIGRMRALIETARKEVTVFISQVAVLRGLKESLSEARKRRGVKLNIAVTQELLEKEDCSGLGEIRLLCCSVGMLISDVKTLLTLSDWMEQTAMLTQDQNLIRVARDYYDNPSVAQVCNCQEGRIQSQA